MECLGENTVTDLMDALMAPARRAEVEAHAARCASCRRLLSELVRRSTRAAGDEPSLDAPAQAREIAPGTHVGRYVVKAKIGSGAMGAVFAAFDPELDRAVALKLLHPANAQRERIQSEARALARLSHPNVVAAYDAGTFEGDLFLAMELVDGTSLRAWSSAAPRTPAEVLDVFRQAGRGLAAAHRAGLVHRDFKPENVLLGTDGRVRVADFGLAAGREGTAELVGTPAYMAPEQFESGRTDAASDQFAFCVALHEALHGERPFAVNLLPDVTAGPAKGRASVSPGIAAAIARGLAPDPALRHRSMDALLDALSRDPGVRRRRALAGGAAIAGIAIAAIAGARWAARAPLCHDSPAVFAKVWSPERKAAIHAHFASLRAPFAEDAWSAIERGMDGFGARWSDARTDACEATRVRGVQSDQVLTVRTLCLDRALAEADALANVLAAADPETISRGAASVGALPALEECSNVTALLAPVPPPAGKDAAAVAEIGATLARGRALRDAARWADAEQVARSAVERARTLSHAPTLAASLFLLGEAQEGAGNAKEAEATIREAYASAETGRDDLLSARAATELVFVIGQQQTRFDDGLEWAFHAETALKRAGGSPEIEARLASDLGHIRFGQNDYPAARTQYQKALDLRSQFAGPDSLLVAKSLFNLGRAVMAEGDNPTGRTLTERAVAILEKNLGPKHPDVGLGLNGLGAIVSNQGKYDEALALFDRALAITDPTLGPDHPQVGMISINRGTALHGLGREEEAIAAGERGFRIYDRDGRDRVSAATALVGIGDAQQSLKRPEDALASYRKALAIYRDVVGDESEEVASALESISTVLRTLGRYDEALAGDRRALAIRDKVDEPDYFEKAFALSGIGEDELRLGHAEKAVAPMRRAVALLTPYDGDPATLAGARFLLAQALWDAGKSQTEARALAAEAEKVLATAGPTAADSLEKVRAWQRAHAPNG